MSRARAWVNANPAAALFWFGLAGSMAVLVAVGLHTTFMRGDWDLLLYRRGSLEAALLEPSGGNLVLGTAAIYRAFVHLFGLDPTAFRILLTLLFAVSSALLFVTLGRRVGVAAAAVGAGLTLLMGAAHQDLLWPLQLGYVVGVACGLGALLALDRRDRIGDVLACALLCVGTLTFTAGAAFAVSAAVAIALGPATRRRIWVAVVPGLLLGIWLVGWGRQATAAPDLSEILDAPLFVIDWLSWSIAALLGLSTPQNASAIPGIDWGRALLLVGVCAAAWRIRRLGKVPAGLWPPLAGALAFGLVAAAYEEPGRLATASRYTYIGAVFILLMTAELAAGTRLRRPAVIALLALAALAASSSANFLGHAGDRYARQGSLERAGLTAIELARDSVPPGFTLDQRFLGTGWASISAGPYLAAVDAYGGSLAYSESDLRQQPLYVRVAADRALAAALGVRARPTQVAAGADCKIVDARSGAAAFELPPGGASLDPGATTASLSLGRFGKGAFAVHLGRIGPGPVALAIPADSSSRPWEAQVSGGARLSVCPLG